jgi:hypothetical protein
MILDLGTRWRWLSTSHPGRFTPGEKTPSSNWMGGRVGFTTGLDTVEKELCNRRYLKRQPLFIPSHKYLLSLYRTHGRTSVEYLKVACCRLPVAD